MRYIEHRAATLPGARAAEPPVPSLARRQTCCVSQLMTAVGLYVQLQRLTFSAAKILCRTLLIAFTHENLPARVGISMCGISLPVLHMWMLACLLRQGVLPMPAQLRGVFLNCSPKHLNYASKKQQYITWLFLVSYVSMNQLSHSSVLLTEGKTGGHCMWQLVQSACVCLQIPVFPNPRSMQAVVV